MSDLSKIERQVKAIVKKIAPYLDAHSSREAIQETLIQFWKTYLLKEYPITTSIGSCLYVIARNTVFKKRKGKIDLIDFESFERTLSAENTEGVECVVGEKASAKFEPPLTRNDLIFQPDAHSGINDQIKTDLKYLQDNIDELEWKLLVAWAGYKDVKDCEHIYQEIAEEFNLSAKDVSNKIHRTRKRIRQWREQGILQYRTCTRNVEKNKDKKEGQNKEQKGNK